MRCLLPYFFSMLPHFFKSTSCCCREAQPRKGIGHAGGRRMKMQPLGGSMLPGSTADHLFSASKRTPSGNFPDFSLPSVQATCQRGLPRRPAANTPKRASTGGRPPVKAGSSTPARVTHPPRWRRTPPRARLLRPLEPLVPPHLPAPLTPRSLVTARGVTPGPNYHCA